MKNLTLAISVATLLLAGQSAMAGSQDEVTIPELGRVTTQVETNQNFIKAAFTKNTADTQYDATQDVFSIDYSSDK